MSNFLWGSSLTHQGLDATFPTTAGWASDVKTQGGVASVRRGPHFGPSFSQSLEWLQWTAVDFNSAMVYWLLTPSSPDSRLQLTLILWASSVSGPFFSSWSFPWLFWSGFLLCLHNPSPPMVHGTVRKPLQYRGARGWLEVDSLHFLTQFISRQATFCQALLRQSFFTSLTLEKLWNCFHPLPVDSATLASLGLSGIQASRKACYKEKGTWRWEARWHADQPEVQ